MNLDDLINHACNKGNFQSIEDYIEFAKRYLEYASSELQAVIVSRNENKYNFFQYGKAGAFNITRPINSEIYLALNEFEDLSNQYLSAIPAIRRDKSSGGLPPNLLNRVVYSAQQSIGACLDALPANKSNIARKINGDLFERFIRLLIESCGIEVKEGTVRIPVIIDGEEAFKVNYQHDLIISDQNNIRAIGSVKTSSKDRIDKVFIDKFLHNRLTDEKTPHFAIFLNDVQRKGQEGKYGVSATFLPGRFKGYTVKLNPLDGVYYLDIRPNMQTDSLLEQHISSFEQLIFKDIWKFVE